MTEIEQLRTLLSDFSCSEHEKTDSLQLLKKIEKSFVKNKFAYETTLEATQRLTLLLTATSEDLTIALEEGEKRSLELAKSNEEIQRQQLSLEEQAAKIQLANTALQERNIDLERLNTEKNEFLGIAAHDLKNPLAGITLWADLLIQYGTSFPQDQLIDKLQNIKQSALRMSTLITNLLDINTIESGGIKLEPEDFDFTAIVLAHCTEYSDRAKVKNISVIPPNQGIDESIVIHADRYYTSEIIDNLLSNAVKYSPHGRCIWLNIELRPLVKVSVTIRNNYQVVLSVKDEGPGLSEQDQKKLFTKFARLSAQPTGGESSTGLGLSIVKKLAEQMNGTVWCESIEGKGATFFFALPLYIEEITEKQGDASLQSGHNQEISRIFAFADEQIRANPSELLIPLEKALEIATGEHLLPEQAKVLRYLGVAHIRLSEFSKAQEFLQRALSLFRQLGDETSQAAVLGNIGLTFFNQSIYQQALHYHEESLQLWQKLGGQLGESQALINIGLIHYHQGELDKARYYYSEALKIKRLIGDKHGESLALNNLANVFDALGEMSNALTLYQQSLEIKRQTGDKLTEANTLRNISSVYLRHSHFQLALDYCRESLTLYQSIKNRSGIADCLNALATIMVKSENDESALQTGLEYSLQSIEIYREISRPIGVSAALFAISEIYKKLGRLNEAYPFLEESLQIAESIGQIHSIAKAHRLLSEYYEACSDTGRALAHFKMYFEYKEKINAGHTVQIDSLY